MLARSTESQAIDAIETLVGRAQVLVHSVLPLVPGVNECMKSQNLFLGLSLLPEGRNMFKDLMELQNPPGRLAVCPTRHCGSNFKSKAKLCDLPGSARGALAG